MCACGPCGVCVVGVPYGCTRVHIIVHIRTCACRLCSGAGELKVLPQRHEAAHEALRSSTSEWMERASRLWTHGNFSSRLSGPLANSVLGSIVHVLVLHGKLVTHTTHTHTHLSQGSVFELLRLPAHSALRRRRRGSFRGWSGASGGGTAAAAEAPAALPPLCWRECARAPPVVLAAGNAAAAVGSVAVPAPPPAAPRLPFAVAVAQCNADGSAAAPSQTLAPHLAQRWPSLAPGHRSWDGPVQALSARSAAVVRCERQAVW